MSPGRSVLRAAVALGRCLACAALLVGLFALLPVVASRGAVAETSSPALSSPGSVPDSALVAAIAERNVPGADQRPCTVGPSATRAPPRNVILYQRATFGVACLLAKDRILLRAPKQGPPRGAPTC